MAGNSHHGRSRRRAAGARGGPNAMMRSMFAGVSSLRAHQMMMDVVGDNIANVNTAGFKSSRVVFENTLSQLLRGGSQPGNRDSAGMSQPGGGINPMQVGLGVRVASVDTTD